MSIMSTKMPFGLTNTQTVFQTLVNDVLQNFLNHFVFVYHYDIFTFSSDLETHQRQVRQVLESLLQHHLFIKAEMCEFHTSTFHSLDSSSLWVTSA